MQFEVGKIITFDNYTGEILSTNGEKYMFLNKDLKEGENYRKDDIVIFRPEDIFDEKKAFHIQKLENVLKDKKKRDKILRKIGMITNDNK